MPRIKRSFITLLSLMLSALVLHAAESADWSEDYAASLEQAKSEDRPVLLLFTGSDWCPPCQYMEKNVFSSDTFSDYASENLVLVKLDFLRRTPQDAAIRDQNAELAEQYDIMAFPTMFVLSPEGEILNKTMGANPRTPEDFVAMLKSTLD